MNDAKIYFEVVDGFDVKLPTYGTEFSAGIDCYLPRFTCDQLKSFGKCCNDNCGCNSIIIYSGEIVKIPLGVKCAFDNQYVLMAKNRSGLSLKGLTKLSQVIDSDYRGQLFVSFYNCGPDRIELNFGDRIIQLVLLPYIHAEICEGIPKEYKDTERGEGGFGSTGK